MKSRQNSTRALILAAGSGSRLMPLTRDRPKCMVEFFGKTLLQRQCEIFENRGIKKIAIAAGYYAHAIIGENLEHYINPNYAHTNMVESLMAARPWIEEAAIAGDDLIVSYGDIIFSDNVLATLLDCSGSLCVAVDTGWRDYWQLRAENPLEDAETLKISKDGLICELGKKTHSYQDIEGQYIGLQKWQATIIPALLDFYDRMDRSISYDGRIFQQMFMTSFLQALIDEKFKVTPAFIRHGWLEFDTISDMNLYKDLAARGGLEVFYDYT